MKEMSSEKYYKEIDIKPEKDKQAFEENEAMQMALRSMEKREKELNPEEKEDLEKMVEGARNVMKCFNLKRSSDNKRGENLVVVTDTGVDELVRIAIAKAAHEAAGDDARVIVTPSPEHPAQDFLETVGQKIKHADAILYATSISRSHSKESSELLNAHPNELVAKVQEWRKKRRGVDFPTNSRLISITTTTKEILTEGASQEDPKQIQKRVEKMYEAMEDVKKAYISSEAGTNLEVDIKENTVIADDGRINKPGMASNFPVGEWACAPNLAKTNGVLVVDGAATNIGRVDKPMRIEIKNGVAVKIEGGKAAKKLEKMLKEANEELKKKNPKSKSNAFRVAELGFGMNSKAFRYNEKGEKISPPTSLEGEKGLGTIHIAFGRNTLFRIKKEDPDYNDVPIHIDNVVMKPTVVGEKKNGEKVKIIKNGEFSIE